MNFVQKRRRIDIEKKTSGGASTPQRSGKTILEPIMTPTRSKRPKRLQYQQPDSFRLRTHHAKTEQAIALLQELYPGRPWVLKIIHQLRAAERQMVVMALASNQGDE